MRRALRALGILIAVLALAISGAWVALYVGTPAEKAPGLARAPAPVSASVPGSEAAPFAKQGENQCGAYSLALGLRLVASVSVTGAELVPFVGHEFSWSETLSGTMPWKVVLEAGRRGISSEGFTARGLEPAERLDLLRGHLARGCPIVLLIESERRSQHFILAVGYTPDGFHIYDPNYEASKSDPTITVDANGPAPGNRTLPSETLLAMWAKGGIAGLYTWWYVPLGK